MRIREIFIVYLAGCVLSACSASSGSNPELTGLGLGTAAGAIVGASSSHIRTADAALIGAGAGLVAGAIVDSGALAVGAGSGITDSELERNSEIISARQREIEELREKVAVETADTDANNSNARYKYVGQSLANPYR